MREDSVLTYAVFKMRVLLYGYSMSSVDGYFLLWCYQGKLLLPFVEPCCPLNV